MTRHSQKQPDHPRFCMLSRRSARAVVPVAGYKHEFVGAGAQLVLDVGDKVLQRADVASAASDGCQASASSPWRAEWGPSAIAILSRLPFLAADRARGPGTS